METRDIRLRNLLKLAADYEKAQDFCAAIEIAPSYFSQVKAATKAIGDGIARRVERKLRLPRGWMDVDQGGSTTTTKMPSDTLGIAYTIEGFPPRIRDTLKHLVLEVAAELSSNRVTPQIEVPPFEGVDDGREDTEVRPQSRSEGNGGEK